MESLYTSLAEYVLLITFSTFDKAGNVPTIFHCNISMTKALIVILANNDYNAIFKALKNTCTLIYKL